MSDANSPQTPAAGAVNFDAGLVRQGDKDVMDAVNAIPEPTVKTIGMAPVPEVPVSVAEPVLKKVSALTHTLSVIPIITFSLGDDVVADLKELKAVSIGDDTNSTTYNFYNPILKGNADKQLHEGLLRSVFKQILDLADALEQRQLLILGKPEDASATIAEVAQTHTESIRRVFPLSQDSTVMELDDAVLKFSDLFNVDSWTYTVANESLGILETHLAVHVAINAGALYATDDPSLFMTRVASFVRNTLNGRQDTRNVYVGVALNALDLEAETTFSFMEALLHPVAEADSEEAVNKASSAYGIITRRSVEQGNAEWAPPSCVDRLFKNDTDLLLLQTVSIKAEDTEEAS